MGVSYTDNGVSCPNKERQNENISEVNINSMYRSEEIYKECSYQLPAMNFFKTKKRKLTNPNLKSQDIIIELPMNNQDLYTQYYWSKVYNSPVTERQCKQKQVKDTTRRHSSEYNLNCEHCANFKNDTNIVLPSHMSTENVATSVASFLKSRQSLSSKVKEWYKDTFPRFLCPCCTGGSDGMAPYHSQSAVGSYESIDLKVCSNNAIDSLNLDASLMSIIHLHKRLKTKRPPKPYAKIVRGVFRNTYKNAMCLITSK